MSALALLWIVLLLSADQDPEPPKDVKKELASLQAEWTMGSMETRGKKAADAQVKLSRLTIKGDKWIVKIGGGKGVEPAGSTMTIDPSKKPKTLDLKGTRSASKGIYKLEGDTLTLCRVTGKAERPKEFKTTAESGILVVWKRVKK
jgi:uncharacterized protein (TIGR03067 family)